MRSIQRVPSLVQVFEVQRPFDERYPWKATHRTLYFVAGRVSLILRLEVDVASPHAWAVALKV